MSQVQSWHLGFRTSVTDRKNIAHPQHVASAGSGVAPAGCHRAASRLRRPGPCCARAAGGVRPLVSTACSAPRRVSLPRLGSNHQAAGLPAYDCFQDNIFQSPETPVRSSRRRPFFFANRHPGKCWPTFASRIRWTVQKQNGNFLCNCNCNCNFDSLRCHDLWVMKGGAKFMRGVPNSEGGRKSSACQKVRWNLSLVIQLVL